MQLGLKSPKQLNSSSIHSIGFSPTYVLELNGVITQRLARIAFVGSHLHPTMWCSLQETSHCASGEASVADLPSSASSARRGVVARSQSHWRAVIGSGDVRPEELKNGRPSPQPCRRWPLDWDVSSTTISFRSVLLVESDGVSRTPHCQAPGPCMLTLSS